MTNMTRFPIESVVNVNSIVKVTHTIKCVITLLLNDKHDEIPYRICRGCQFYSQSENANAKYMIRHDMRSIALLCDESIDSYKNKK